MPVSDSGFVDEAPKRARPRQGAPTPGGGPVAPEPPQPPGTNGPRGTRRPGPAATVFVVLLLVFVGLAGWAWTSRVHADDVAAFTALGRDVTEMDRLLTPQGHGEAPPCRDSDDGVVTRTYPPSTGPAAAQMVGYLQQSGWFSSAPTPPAVAHLTRTVQGHVQTIDLVAPSLDQLVTTLTARSAASAFGCLGR